mmetsp:Transcript_69418/g.165423  ORF Transcript_69418/g.165423 Transcript_69418/m.165423 type:complete len:537 (-) Transcript_69418:330-1940(-)
MVSHASLLSFDDSDGVSVECADCSRQAMLTLQSPLLEVRSLLLRLRLEQEVAHPLRLLHGWNDLQGPSKLQLKSHGNVLRTLTVHHVELNRPRNAVHVAGSQIHADLLVEVEGLRHVAIQLHQGFADHGLVLALASLNDAQRGYWYAAALPLLARGQQIFHTGNQAGAAVHQQGGCSVAQGVAVGRVKDSGHACAALVTEGMELWREIALVPLDAAALQLRVHRGGQQLLRLDLGDLHVAVGVAVQKQLRPDEAGQIPEAVCVLLGQDLQDALLSGFHSRQGQLVVDFGDQRIELWDELDETFGKKNYPVVLAVLAARFDHVCQIHGDILQALLAFRHLLSKKTGVGPREQGHFQGNIGRRSAHEPDQVVVLLRTQGINGHIAYQGGVGLAGSVEAEGHRDVRWALEITVDGLGRTDNLGLAAIGLEVLGQDGTVRVRIVSADDDQAIKANRVANSHGVPELLLRLNLVASTAQHVKAACVAEPVHDLIRDDHKIAREHPVRPIQKAVHHGLLVPGFDAIKNARDDVVTARSLATG